ncbi:hypothetical protein HHK36_010178 [Tetracentron sinense]|uniref:Cyclin-like domain-containing protein n=1 Tax=Tetracentron sinense TaxID=13715 RepID=A0A834ZKD7_TETSI|nr:hypothetical protein HHK36_010178 [Tetracentron sinense]
MEGQLPGDPSQHGIKRDAAHMVSQYMSDWSQCSTPKWYFTRQEIEDHSPSRKDCIDHKKETYLRKLYCSFLQDLGIKLKVPQVTIATAMMLSHRFYLRQSHANNEWQTIATVSMFLACKLEETPRLLRDVVVVAYETLYKWDPVTSRRIKQKEFYEKQKELILIGERLLLATLAFDLNIQHPYKPLVAAIKRMEISQNDLVKVAWNFVNDWLWTTLCLQYKPHYIAAGSLFLAAKFHHVKLPSERGKVWWLEFDVAPKQLEEVIQQMLRSLEQKRKQVIPSAREKATEATVVIGKAASCSPQSCVLSGGSITVQDSSNATEGEAGGVARSMKTEDTCTDIQNLANGDTCIAIEGEALRCQTSDCRSMNSVVEDGNGYDEIEVQPSTREFNQMSSCKIVSVHGGFSNADKNRIREALKRRRCERATNEKIVEAVDDGIDSEALIERELENGIEVESASAEKRHRRVC